MTNPPFIGKIKGRFVLWSLFFCLSSVFSETFLDDTDDLSVYGDDKIIEKEVRSETPVRIIKKPGGGVLVGCRDSGNIFTLDEKSGKAAVWAKVDRILNVIALDTEANLLYAGIGQAQGEIVAFDLATGRMMWKKKVGHSPVSILARNQKVYVACQFENSIVVLSSTGNIERQYPVTREPVAMAFFGNKGLAVCNALPFGRSTDGNISSHVDLVNLSNDQVTSIPLPSGSHSCRGIATTVDGKYAFVPSIMSKSHLPTTQIEKGWIQTAAVHVIDFSASKVVGTFILDEPEKGAANPWDCMTLSEGKRLAIALAGTHEVMMIDVADLLKRIVVPEKEGVLGELAAISQRISLRPDQGVRSICPKEGGGFWFAATFSESVGFVGEEGTEPSFRVALGRNTPVANRRGEALFHDATLSMQGWISCSSCHPNNGADALNWFRMYGEVGSFMNTKSVVGSVATPPTTWTGFRPDAHSSVLYAFRKSLYREPEKEEVEEVWAYLGSLKYMRSPYLEKEDQAVVRRGRSLFNTKGCINCHEGPHLTDLESHNVGTGEGVDSEKTFDVPTLREVWRTAPYLHDGSALTIEDAIRILGRSKKVNKGEPFTEEEIKALAAFVRTL